MTLGCQAENSRRSRSSGVTLGMGAPLLAPPSPIWRPLSPQEGVLLNVSFKIKSRQNSENDGKILKKTYISSLKRVLLLVLQLSFPKNVPHFPAILRPPETAPPCSAGSAGPIVTPLSVMVSKSKFCKFRPCWKLPTETIEGVICGLRWN